MKQFIKMECYRTFTSKNLIVSLAGVVAVYLLGWIEVSFCKDIFSIFYYLRMYSITILIFAFNTCAYANTLVEDAEHKYWYLLILRGERKKYIWAKVVVNFVTAVVVSVMGTVIFTMIAAVRLPLLAEDEFLTALLKENVSFGGLLEGNAGLVLLYFILEAVMLGMFAGILSLFSMWLSLYVRNRMFTICIPVVGYYFWGNYFSRIFGDFIYLDFDAIYLGNEKVFATSLSSFLYAIALSAIFGIVIGEWMQGKVKKEIQGESNEHRCSLESDEA